MAAKFTLELSFAGPQNEVFCTKVVTNDRNELNDQIAIIQRWIDKMTPDEAGQLSPTRILGCGAGESIQEKIARMVPQSFDAPSKAVGSAIAADMPSMPLDQNPLYQYICAEYLEPNKNISIKLAQFRNNALTSPICANKIKKGQIVSLLKKISPGILFKQRRFGEIFISVKAECMRELFIKHSLPILAAEYDDFSDLDAHSDTSTATTIATVSVASAGGEVAAYNQVPAGVQKAHR